MNINSALKIVGVIFIFLVIALPAIERSGKNIGIYPRIIDDYINNLSQKLNSDGRYPVYLSNYSSNKSQKLILKNIKEKFHQGVRLKPGKVEFVIYLPNKVKSTWVEIKPMKNFLKLSRNGAINEQ